MAREQAANAIEAQIAQWRVALQNDGGRAADGIAAFEARLRTEIAQLAGAGLDADEVFLVALKRQGDVDGATRAFTQAHAQRLLQQRVPAKGERGVWWRSEAAIATALALLAAATIKLPELFGLRPEYDDVFYARNLGLFVLPFVALYFVCTRGATRAMLGVLVTAVIAAAVFANIHFMAPTAYPQELTALHLPIALWLVVGLAFAAGRWPTVAVRMNFVRFSGELFIHCVLFALGGIVLTGMMMGLFQAIGVDMEPLFQRWLLPCGGVAAIVIGTWLVAARHGVVAHIAPLLTRMFTPLFAVLLLAFLATMLWTGRTLDFQRELIIALDLLLVIVLGLLLYSISARDPSRPAGPFDVLQIVLVVSALLVNALALTVIATRISEFGFTPNRVAALGENLILLVNLAWSAVLYLRFLRGGVAFSELERWQTSFLPVYALWAAFVVAVFPLLFGAR